MSRDSLLDEAIVKAKETKDWQLVEWLRMARGGESAAKWYTEKLRDANQTVRKLLDENAKLREERDMYRDLVGNMVHPDIPDQLYAENVKLRELVRDMWCELDAATQYDAGGGRGVVYEFADRMRELGVKV